SRARRARRGRRSRSRAIRRSKARPAATTARASAARSPSTSIPRSRARSGRRASRSAASRSRASDELLIDSLIMRQPLDPDRLRRVLEALGRACRGPGTLYLTGGVTALLEGWRAATIDVEVKLDPEPEGMFAAI